MNIKKNTAAAAFAAMAIAGFSAPAFATFTDLTATNIVVTETKAATIAAGIAQGNDIVYNVALNDIFDVSAPDKITATLSAGKWKTVPTLTASATWKLNTVVPTNPVPAGAAAVGGAVATWSVVNGAGLAAKDTLTLGTAAAKIDLTGVTGPVDVTLEMWSGAVSLGKVTYTGNNAATGAPVKIFTFKPIALATNKVATVDDIADVSQVPAFAKFKATKKATSSNIVVSLGTQTAFTLTQEAAVITIAGDFTNIKSITSATANKITSSLADGTDATVAAVKGTTVANTFAIDAAAGKAYARVTDVLGTTQNITLNLVGNGTGPLNAGSYTISAVTVAGTTPNTNAYTLGSNVLSSATALSLTRNGSSFNTVNLGPLNTLKISENAGLTGALTFSPVDAAGKAAALVVPAAGTPALPTSLAANQTLTVKGSTLFAYYPTAQKFTVNVESSDVTFSSVKKASTGATLTVTRTGSDSAI